MAGGDADVLDVVGADALLGRRGARGARRGQPQEDGLERDHARDGEHDGGVVRNEGCGRQAGVGLGLVEGQEGLPDLGGGHALAYRDLRVDLSPGWGGGGGRIGGCGGLDAHCMAEQVRRRAGAHGRAAEKRMSGGAACQGERGRESGFHS